MNPTPQSTARIEMTDRTRMSDLERLQAAREELAAIQDDVNTGRALEALIKELERRVGVTAVEVDNAFDALVTRRRAERHQQAFAQEMMEEFARG